MLVNLHRGRGLISALIRWQTRSPYSHASISLSDGEVVESRQGCGVRILQGLPHAEEVDQFEFDHTPEQEVQCSHFLIKQIGKKYDWTMVFRFLTREQYSRKARGKWFCSELVFAALQKAGIQLLARVEPWEVSPGLLARSPLLRLRAHWQPAPVFSMPWGAPVPAPC